MFNRSSRHVSVGPSSGASSSDSEPTAVKAFRDGEVDAFNMDSDADFWDSYEDIRTLGRGTFAKVKEVEHVDTKERFAAKIMDKDPMNNDMDDMVREVQILSMLRHRNVICLYGAYETPRKLYLVTELADGGELMQLGKGVKVYAEDMAMRHTYTICDAIAYMHGVNVAHRDLKPENVLLGGPKRTTIKIVDMGLSRPYDRQLMTTICGTHKYLAPELVECDRGTLRGYDATVDVWGVGLLAYIMLFGTNPFAKDSTPATHEAILRCDIPFPSGGAASDLAKAFIRETVCRKAKDRPSATDALAHEWLHGAGGGGGGDSIPASRPASASAPAKKGSVLGGMFRRKDK